MRMSVPSVIFDAAGIKAEMATCDWAEDYENPDQQRRGVYLGSILNLTPSGKFYLPFACSNVTPCPVCAGQGNLACPSTGRRKAKKARSRESSYSRRTIARGGAQESAGAAYCRRIAGQRADAYKRASRFRPVCTYCHGVGSREAYLDEIWREQAEREINAMGYSLEGSEGDGCDLLAIEYRDKPEDDENDDGHEPGYYDGGDDDCFDGGRQSDADGRL